MASKYDGFGISKKKTTKWGEGGVGGGGTKYDQLSIKNDQFTIVKESGLNKHKATVKTDKPFDEHVK